MAFKPIADGARFDRPRSLVRSAIMLFALLFALLRPVCDAFAASGDPHESEVARQGYVQLADAPGPGHTHDEICCSSVDSDALAVPSIAPLPLTPAGDLAAPSGAMLQTFTSVACPSKVTARRDPAPPLSYHARSLRRLV
jgi:hypothetical protein